MPELTMPTPALSDATDATPPLSDQPQPEQAEPGPAEPGPAEPGQPHAEPTRQPDEEEEPQAGSPS